MKQFKDEKWNKTEEKIIKKQEICDDYILSLVYILKIKCVFLNTKQTENSFFYSLRDFCK